MAYEKAIEDILLAISEDYHDLPNVFPNFTPIELAFYVAFDFNVKWYRHAHESHWIKHEEVLGYPIPFDPDINDPELIPQ